MKPSPHPIGPPAFTIDTTGLSYTPAARFKQRQFVRAGCIGQLEQYAPAKFKVILVAWDQPIAHFYHEHLPGCTIRLWSRALSTTYLLPHLMKQPTSIPTESERS